MDKAFLMKLKYIFEHFDKFVLLVTTILFSIGFFCLATFLNGLEIELAFDLAFLPIYGFASILLSSVLVVSLMIPYFIGASREIIPSFRIGKFYDLSCRYFVCVAIPLFIFAVFICNGINFLWSMAGYFALQFFYVAFLLYRFRRTLSWKSKFYLKEFAALLSFFMFFSIFVTLVFAIDFIYVFEMLVDRRMESIEALYPYVGFCVGFAVVLYLPILVARGGYYNFAVTFFSVVIFLLVMVWFPDFLAKRTLRWVGSGGGVVKNYTVRMEDFGAMSLRAKEVFCNSSINCSFVISRRVCVWFSTGADLYISEISAIDARKKFCAEPQGKVFSLAKSFLVEQ
ncbi:hypothetical protein [Vogesella indigofera]|uniref:Uncharacterized protein n=1 Tax=Vogesella indigofera TaxID=45465 RepID=A0ABT5I4I5_VOGIN|nr:hypothetical protein [Vogesella indigofera]MDC7691081.1 hypothetical protein [Vogesella indigofera]